MATARFECDANHLRETLARMEKRTGTNYHQISIDGYNDYYCIAYGERQELMALIGAVADEGSDWLTSYTV